MNRIIIFIILICFIYCDFLSCEEEEDQSKCKSIDIEIDGLSCYKFNFPEFKGCMPYPDDAEDQKKYNRLTAGLMKEEAANILDEEDRNILNEISTYKKETDEIITIDTIPLTDDDKKKIKSNNTCLYLFDGRYTQNIKNYPSGYPNINDKNICFNAEQFSDLKGLINCGHAKILIKAINETYNVSTCFIIPDNRCPQFYQEAFKNKAAEGEIGEWLINILDWEDLDKKNRNIKKTKNKRKLQQRQIYGYEMIIEDKFGKILKYTSNSTKAEVISKGDINASSFSEKIYIHDKLNILLTMLFILLIL